jgi:hypothetical protein
MRYEEAKVLLQDGEKQLEKLLARADASPYIAHCELAGELAERLPTAVRVFSCQGFSGLTRLIENWPRLGLWHIASRLTSEYGKGGDSAIYRVLLDSIGSKENADQRERDALNVAFRGACRKLGLALPERSGEAQRRMVADII